MKTLSYTNTKKTKEGHERHAMACIKFIGSMATAEDPNISGFYFNIYARNFGREQCATRGWGKGEASSQ